MSGSGCGSGSGAEVKETGDESEDYVLTGPVDLQPSAVESAASELEREVKIDTFVPEMNMSIAAWQPRDTIYERIKEELLPSTPPPVLCRLLDNEERLATGSVTQVEVTPTIAMEWEDRKLPHFPTYMWSLIRLGKECENRMPFSRQDMGTPIQPYYWHHCRLTRPVK